MKRSLLLFAGLLIGLTTVSATELNHQKPERNPNITKHHRFTQPIMFVERGIEFLIFPDGSFDFNTNSGNSYNNNLYYRRSSRRGHVNATFGIRNRNYRYNNNCYNVGVSISHDRDGKVRRVGDVYINYNRHGKIKRAGSVYMSYSYRHGSLIQVGGLSINYNRWGDIINTRGRVKDHSHYCNFCGIQSCTVDHYFRNRHGNHRNNDCDDDRDDDDHDDDWDDGIYDDDDNYYYYKQNGQVKRLKRSH